MEAGKRMCKYCKRWFPNGKSLGGHMKSHLSLTYPKGTPGAGTSSQPQKKRRVPPSSTGEEFKCKECGKGFPSCRAYWGHMRWHKLVENDDSNNNIDINENASDEDAQIDHAAHMLVALSRMECSCNYLSCANAEEKFGLEEMETKHECPVCHKIYSTGQALGGHMRSHMPSVPHCAGKTRVLEEQPDLGFDLNAEPPEVSG